MKLFLILFAMPIVACIEEIDCDYLSEHYGLAMCGLTEGTESCEYFTDFNSVYPEPESINGHYHGEPIGEAPQVDGIGEESDYFADGILDSEPMAEYELRECDYHVDITSTKMKMEVKEEL